MFEMVCCFVMQRFLWENVLFARVALHASTVSITSDGKSKRTTQSLHSYTTEHNVEANDWTALKSILFQYLESTCRQIIKIEEDPFRAFMDFQSAWPVLVLQTVALDRRVHICWKQLSRPASNTRFKEICFPSYTEFSQNALLFTIT